MDKVAHRSNAEAIIGADCHLSELEEDVALVVICDQLEVLN